MATTPHGWQNLSSERHRTPDRDQILPTIQTVHEDAYETEIGDSYLAYWLGEDNLVGFAWKADHVWFYAYMNRIAFDAGMNCTLDTTGRKIHILPTVRSRAAIASSEPVVPEPVAAPKRARNVVLSRRVFRENGQWYAVIETKTHVRQLGPFRNKGEAMASPV